MARHLLHGSILATIYGVDKLHYGCGFGPLSKVTFPIFDVFEFFMCCW